MKQPTKETICSCCGEPIYTRGHVYSSSTESITDWNRYFWVSFADEDRFIAVAIVECVEGDPVRKTWELGINPGARENCSVVFQPLSALDLGIFRPYLGQLIRDHAQALKLAKAFR